MSKDINPLAIGQGLFYFSTGIWPIVHYSSFERVTGPKRDAWLVKTVGALIAVSGVGLLASGLRTKKIPPEMKWIATGESMALGTVSGYYSLRGRISKIYLLDSFSEFLIAGMWGALEARGLKRPFSSPRLAA